MWCQHCRQDVPALPSGDQQSLCCPRCGEAVCINSFEATEQPPAYDGWEMDEELRHIEKVLGITKAEDLSSQAVYQREASRFDMPHAAPTAWHVPTTNEPANRPFQRHKAPMANPPLNVNSLIWGVLSLGTACFACGGVLLGWSWVTGRQELWTIGMPVAMVGQVALLIGLVLQLERLWRDNRDASDKLDNVDEQLSELKATTTLLGTSQGPAASVFYSHFANGAGPQILLTDLKSQIDLLAMKIAQDDR